MRHRQLAIGSDDKSSRYTGTMIHLRKSAGDLVDLKIIAFSDPERFGCVKFVIQSKHDKFNILILYIMIQFLNAGHFCNAGRAPGGPEIHENYFSFELLQMDFFS